MDDKEEVAIDTAMIEYIRGQFDPSKHKDFISIPDQYASRSGLYLRREALSDFIKMYNEAHGAGVSLIIKSATRNFDYQKGIWERKWHGQTLLEGNVDARTISDPKERALKILLYSSMPSTSRHHWGTDIDLNSFDNSYFEKGRGKKEYTWLRENAHKFGFCQPYTSKENGRTGYEEEKWHWTYLPISKGLTDYAERYLKNEDISGFAGAELAIDIDVVGNYILGIDPSCL